MQLIDHSHCDWDLKLTEILFNLRTRKNTATGKTPSQVLFGETIQRPGQWVLGNTQDGTSDSETRLQEVRENQARYLRRQEIPPTSESVYKEGDWIRVRAHHLSDKGNFFHAGLASRWDGPYKVVNVMSNEIYEIDQNGRKVKTHVNDIKPVFTAPLSPDYQMHQPTKRRRGRPPGKKKKLVSTNGLETTKEDSGTKVPEIIDSSTERDNCRIYNLRSRVNNRRN